jgi:Phage tail sheath protein.
MGCVNMAERILGDQFKFIRHVIELRPIGRRTVVLGRGVVLGFGTAARGPAFEPYFVAQGQQRLVRRTYYSGKLADDLETALDQGCSIAGGIRILGEGYSTATLNVTDSQTPGNKVGTFTANGPGAAGNSVSITITKGDITNPIQETFPGDGGATYYLLRDDIAEATYNRVKVGGTQYTIIYEGIPDEGEVLLDKTKGSITFNENQKPTESQLIDVRYRHNTRKVIIQDAIAGGAPLVFNNIISQEMLYARLRDNWVATYTPAVGETHLPKVMPATPLSGGSDGDPITVDDWEKAFQIALSALPEGIIPSAVFTTDHSLDETNQLEIIPLLSAYLNNMEKRITPCQGFVSLPPTMSTAEMVEYKRGYDDMWLTLIGNGYSSTERNLAPARAGQEATLPLGTSPGEIGNSFKGVDGLMFQFNEVDQEVLTYNNVEVLIKKDGVRPYVGVTSDPEESFFRTVDVRTIAWCCILADRVVNQFKNARRTLTNLNRLQNSIYVLYNQLLEDKVLDDFSVDVTPNESDHNAVDLHIMLQPVGHMERFYTKMDVGYWSDKIAA